MTAPFDITHAADSSSMDQQPPPSPSPGKTPRPAGYGTPVEGSKTEQRGRQAHDRISNEILELCEIIESQGGPPINAVGVSAIKFSRLFDIYVRISSKLVGVLLRARKYKLVDFEGETLFQGRDDNVIVTLLRLSKDIRVEITGKKKVDEEFKWGTCM